MARVLARWTEKVEYTAVVEVPGPFDEHTEVDRLDVVLADPESRANAHTAVTVEREIEFFEVKDD